MTSERHHWDLARFELFVSVAREGSLTRAAAVVGSPQPAISRQIARLEQECGGRLFLRTGRGVTLSPLGERMLPRVQAILRQAQELAGDLEEGVKAPAGEVRVGALPSLYLSVIVPLFQSLRQRFPGIRLQVFEGSAGQIDQWLTSGYVDIGLPYRYGRNMADAEPLVTVTSYLVGPSGDPLTQPKTIKFSQLDGLPLVLPGAPSGVRLLLAQLARKAGIHLNVVMEADSVQIQKAVAAGAGAYAVLPLHAVAGELEQGRVQVARIVSPRLDRTIAMGMTSARPLTPAVHEVARNIRQLLHGRDASMRNPS